MINDASLVMIPSGYKDGTLYSVKPTNGDGDFTFSRGSNLAATRVNSEGLIEKGRENLLLQSNTFDTTWTLTGSTLTSGQSDKDGGTDAWLLQSNNTGQSFVKQIIALTGVKSYSVFAKAGTSDFLILYAVGGGDARTFFDLANGTTETASNNITNKIEDVGNGWYKCSLIFDKTISDVRLFVADSDGVYNSGNGSNIYIQDAQLESGLVATEYIETTTTTAQAGILEDMPRLDYSGGSCPSLLLEPQRSNLNDQSEYFNGWSQASATVTDNAIISPEGVQNGSLVECTSGRIQKNISLTSGSTYVISLFAKANGDYFSVQVLDGTNPATLFNLSTESTSDSNGATSTIEEFGNGWYRCTMKFTSAYTGATTIRGITSTDTNGVYVYGWQIEQGSYPTSYIPTYGSSVTRSADSCYKTGISSLIGQTEGTLFIEASSDEGGFRTFSVSDGSISNRFTIAFDSTSSIKCIPVFSGTVGSQLSTTYTSGINKVAITYGDSDYALFVNGTKISTGVLGSFNSDLDKVEFAQGNGGNAFFGTSQQAILFTSKLTDDEAIELTTL